MICVYLKIRFYIFSCLVFLQKFLCGGRLIFGPDVASLFLSTLLIGVPGFTFCIKMLVKIKSDDPHFKYPVLFTGLILTFLVSELKTFLVAQGDLVSKIMI